MNYRIPWEKPHFINVMMHELGHALGIPHLVKEDTEIMSSHGLGCGKEGKDKICQLKDLDLESFLMSYSPEMVEFKREQDYWDEQEKIWDAYMDMLILQQKTLNLKAGSGK